VDELEEMVLPEFGFDSLPWLMISSDFRQTYKDYSTCEKNKVDSPRHGIKRDLVDFVISIHDFMS
jgi:hypothetical protein